MGIHDDPYGTSAAPACAWPAESCPPVPDPDAARAGSAALAPVLPLRPHGSRVDGVPLFCVSGEAGPAWSFAHLITELDARTPVYGLQSVPGADGTLADIVAGFLAEIHRIAPAGPCRLLGWSAGGFVAHELAVALHEAGRDVSVMLLATDPATCADPPPAAWTVGEYIHRFGALLGLDTGAGMLDVPRGDDAATAGFEAPAVDFGADTAGLEAAAMAFDTDIAGYGGANAALAADAAAAALTAVLAGTVDFTGPDLDLLADASHAALRRVAGHRPSLLPGDLTVCVAGRNGDGTDIADPGAAVRNWRPYATGTVTGILLDATPAELLGPELSGEIARALESTPPAARTI
ncbi:thioesterase domain-containing protein [Nocardia sp. SSK8]|uniref:thioesterase domain-containing protein n=1 Tax=Nocardia sp. SSK8 TaxID=3120154 RepID=UPI003009FC21